MGLFCGFSPKFSIALGCHLEFCFPDDNSVMGRDKKTNNTKFVTSIDHHKNLLGMFLGLIHNPNVATRLPFCFFGFQPSDRLSIVI